MTAYGFVSHNVTIREVWVLYHNGYPHVSPDMRLPSGWKLSTDGIGILSLPLSGTDL
jgi:hypothetical protein